MVKLDKVDAIIAEHESSVVIDVNVSALPESMVERASVLLAGLNLHSIPGHFCMTESGLLLYRIFFYTNVLDENQITTLADKYVEEAQKDVSLCLRSFAERMYLKTTFDPENAN